LSNLKVFRVEKGELVEMSEGFSEFTRGDAYLVDAGMKIYCWIGSECSVDEKFLTSISSVLLDQSRGGGDADIDTIDEGEETEQFRALFENFMIVEGDQAGSILKKPPPTTFANKMYRVAGETFEEVELARVPLLKSNLDSGNCYIIETLDTIYLWIGKGSSAKEKFKANIVARKIRSDRGGRPKVLRIEEGQQVTQEFEEAFE
jgi:hypothetical protein